MNFLLKIIYLCWYAGSVYFLYQLYMVDIAAVPGPYWTFTSGSSGSNSRTALIILFAGVLGSVFIAGIVYFVIKFIYNIFVDALHKIFPEDFASVIKSFVLLASLIPCFFYIEKIKTTGLNIQCQIDEVVSTARNLDLKVKTKSAFDKAIEKEDMRNRAADRN